MDGSATHGGGHCQFGVFRDNDWDTAVVLGHQFDDCLTGAENYSIPLDFQDVSVNFTFFWIWHNKFGNR